MPRRFFDRARTLYDVNQALSNALADNGYVETSYFSVPNGFALVTRLEQVERDGSSRESERWSVERPTFRRFALSEYLRLLFTAPTGRYRVIVFVITDLPFHQSPDTTTRDEAVSWLRQGANVLPGVLARMTYRGEYNTSALIYDFVKGTGDARLMNPSEIDAQTHLVRSKLWGYLVKSPAEPLPITEVKLQWQCSSDLDLLVVPSDDPALLGRSADVTNGPGAEIVRTARTRGPMGIEVNYYGGNGPCSYEITVSTNANVRRWSGTVDAPGDKKLLTDVLRP
jgi:hypothetical protein